MRSTTLRNIFVVSNRVGVSAVLLIIVLSALLNSSRLHAETVEVSIYKMRFTPAEITINQGDTVRWINNEKRQYHSVWFKQLGEPKADYFFPEESIERTFNDIGVFPYECGPHPEMTGAVKVVAAKGGQGESEKKSVSESRANELEYLVKQDCGSCHGMLLKGGLGPSLLPSALSKFQIDDLVAVIMYGRLGTPMPPWKGILADADARWIATKLKTGEYVSDAN